MSNLGLWKDGEVREGSVEDLVPVTVKSLWVPIIKGKLLEVRDPLMTLWRTTFDQRIVDPFYYGCLHFVILLSICRLDSVFVFHFLSSYKNYMTLK